MVSILKTGSKQKKPNVANDTKTNLISKKVAKKAKPNPKGISNNLKKNKPSALTDESEIVSNNLKKNKPSALADQSEMLNDEPMIVNDDPITANANPNFKKSIYFLILPSHLFFFFFCRPTVTSPIP